MAIEHRAGVEFRVAGRTLSGTVLRYGDVSPSFRERFMPGAFAPVPAVPLNLQHDSRMVVLDAGEYVLADGPRALSIRADLPPDSAALRLVKRGALNGFSVEFHARAERRESGVRVIERADLVGVGLVDEPGYPGSRAEVRRVQTYIPIRDPRRTRRPPRRPPRRPEGGAGGGLFTDAQRRQIERDWIAAGRPGDVMGWLHDRFPLERLMEGLGVRMVGDYAGAAALDGNGRKTCKCLTGECKLVRFRPEAFEPVRDAVEAGTANVPVHTGSLNPRDMLGDTRSGAVVLDIVPDDAPLRSIVAPGSLVLAFLQGILGTVAGEAVAKSVEVSPPIARPIIDDEQSEFEEVEEDGELVRVYSRAWISSILVKVATDESARGWSTMVLGTVENPGPAPVESAPPRRFRRWL